MARPGSVQSRETLTPVTALGTLLLVLLLVGFVVFFSAMWLFEPIGQDVKHPAIGTTAGWPVVFWCLGWPIALRNPPAGLGTRVQWSIACAGCLLHIAVAFHLAHGWSHEAAWEHTRQVGGYGGGLYANYAVAVVWLADVLWAWFSFDVYRARPRWLNRTVHGLIAFILFNAAFVFGSPEMRFVYAVVLLFVVLRVLSDRRNRAKRLAQSPRSAE